MKTKVPLNARQIHYRYGRHRGEFAVWKSEKINTETWYWSALGRDGEAVGSIEMAIRAAREWIVNSKSK